MEKPRILLVENIHPVAKAALEAEGFEVDLISHAPAEAELIPLLKNYNVIGIRSKTEITPEVLKHNPQLAGVLPKTYNLFTSTLLKELLKKLPDGMTLTRR